MRSGGSEWNRAASCHVMEFSPNPYLCQAIIRRMHRFAFLWLILLPAFSIGQSKARFLEGGFSLNKPSGIFAKNLTASKLGLDIGYLQQLKQEKPLFWGVGLYFIPLDEGGVTLSEPLDFQLVDFDYSTSTSIVGLQGKFRFYPDVYLAKAEFYLEALAGFKAIITTTTKTLVSDGSADSNFEKTGFSVSYGAAAGVNYPIADKWFINARASYLPGVSTRYYVFNPAASAQTSSLDLFDFKSSPTDLIRWELGIMYHITGSQNEE